MKKIIALMVSCAVLFLMSSCTKGCRSNNATEVINIGTNANFPPYESMDKNGQVVGFDVDVGRAIGKILGREVVFKEFDFDALILALNKGQIDVIMSGMSITESRQKEIAMVPYQGDPLMDLSLLFWEVMPENVTTFADVKRVAEEKNLAVTVQAGHFLEEFLKGENIPLKPLVGPPEQILDIKYRKSFAAAVDTTVGKKLSSEHAGLKNLVLPLPKEKWDLGNGIGIKKSRVELIADISRAVEELKKNGTLDQLKQKWFKDEQ